MIDFMNESEAGCIFCGVAAGAAAAQIVYGDDLVLAFLDHRPINPGHLLVIPRIHAQRLADLPEAVGGHLFQIAQRLSLALRSSGLKGDGISLLVADGEEADQGIPHLHLHLIPRFRGDGVRIEEGIEVERSPDRLQEMAQRIRSQILETSRLGVVPVSQSPSAPA